MNHVLKVSHTSTVVSEFIAFKFFWWISVWLIPLGALAVFQSSQEINAQKIVYTSYIGLTAFIALYFINTKAVRSRLFTLNLAVFGILIAFMCSLFMVFGDITTQAIRNLVPYLLFGLAPVIGVALGLVFTPRYLKVALLSVACLSALLTFTDWVARRGASDIFGKAGLASATLAALGFSVALWSSFYSRGKARILQSFVSGFILIAMLSTGSRTNLLFLLAILPIIVPRAKWNRARDAKLSGKRRSVLKTTVQFAIVGLAGFVVLQYLNLADFILLRLVNLNQVLLADAFSDQSFLLRQAAYDYGARVYVDSPIFGSGFDQNFSGPIGDTPYSALLKVGAFGFAICAGWFLALGRKTRQLLDTNVDIAKGIQGWIVILVGISFSGPVFEDKSTAIALVFVTALLTSQLAQARVQRDS